MGWLLPAPACYGASLSYIENFTDVAVSALQENIGF